MAILWQKKINDNRYEIRSAGRTRRLYTNGVCHSEFNPVQVFTGSIWDLLVLPSWFYRPQAIRRVLVLGVGGGAVLLQLDRLLEAEALIGIEADPVHLYLAERFFGSAGPGITCVRSEARAWLGDYAGEGFDMIIDDLYVDDGDDPVRAIDVDGGWAELLLRHLRPEGLLTVNFASRRELLDSALFAKARYNRRFASVFQMTTPLLDNHVGVFAGRASSSRTLRDRILRNPAIERAVRNRRIRYRIRQLK
jgi:spermidine synthase